MMNMDVDTGALANLFCTLISRRAPILRVTIQIFANIFENSCAFVILHCSL